MASWSFFSHSAPVATQSSSVPFLVGTVFQCQPSSGVICWYEGYWWYAGGAVTPQTFCLYAVNGGQNSSLNGTMSGTVVTGSTVLSGPITPNSWNYIPLPAPIPLAVGASYSAQTGFTISGTFACANGSFSSGGTYPGGITSGPIFAYSDATAGGAAGTTCPWGGIGQSTFATGHGTDPTSFFCVAGSNSAFFGLDVQVSDAVPAGFAPSSWSLYPSCPGALAALATLDAVAPYELAVRVQASRACKLPAVRYFSPAGSASIASWCGVWDMSTESLVSQQQSPAWLTDQGSAGSKGGGWLHAALPSPVLLMAGHQYALAVWCSSPAGGWSVLEGASDRWGTGVLANGITAGPVTALGWSASPSAYEYNNNPAGSPPYSNGTLLAHGQSVFGQTVAGAAAPPPYPQLWASSGTKGDLTQDYGVDGVFEEASSSGLVLAAYI